MSFENRSLVPMMAGDNDPDRQEMERITKNNEDVIFPTIALLAIINSMFFASLAFDTGAIFEGETTLQAEASGFALRSLRNLPFGIAGALILTSFVIAAAVMRRR